MQLCENRLTVVGAKPTLARLGRKVEPSRFGKYFELLEHSAKRLSWQFESNGFPLQTLAHISRQWPTLTFLLDSDNRTRRIKLLAKVVNGTVKNYEVRY